MCPNKPEITKILVESAKYKLAATLNRHIEPIALLLMSICVGAFSILLMSGVVRIIYDVFTQTPVTK